MSNLKSPMLNEALKLIRLYWGHTQKEMAEILQISQPHISEIENGNKSVSLEILERYSSKLGVRMSQLLFFAEELEGHPPIKKGQLIVAQKVLQLLRALGPTENEDA